MKSHKLSAGVVVVRKTGKGYLYLLLRAYDYWDFPKGNVEAGEEPLAAARREVLEETGVDELIFRWKNIYAETEPYGQGKIARYYLAETTQENLVLPPNPEGRYEHHEYRWLPYAEAKKLLVPRVEKILDWAHSVIEKKLNAEREGFEPSIEV